MNVKLYHIMQTIKCDQNIFRILCLPMLPRGGTRGQSQLGAGATDQGLVSGGNPVSGPEIVTPLLTIERQFKNGIIKILNGIIKFVNV